MAVEENAWVHCVFWSSELSWLTDRKQFRFVLCNTLEFLYMYIDIHIVGWCPWLEHEALTKPAYLDQCCAIRGFLPNFPYSILIVWMRFRFMGYVTYPYFCALWFEPSLLCFFWPWQSVFNSMRLASFNLSCYRVFSWIFNLVQETCCHYGEQSLSVKFCFILANTTFELVIWSMLRCRNYSGMRTWC